MSFNLLDSVSGLLGNDIIGNASNVLGESEGNMQKAVSMNKAGSGDVGNLLKMAKVTFNSGLQSTKCL